MTSTTPRKRRAYAARVPAEQRRTQVLDAALHLVVARGHNATTMDAVAEQAGVTKPVVYGQFRSRNELLAALLRREQEAALQQLLEVLPGDPGKLLTEDAPEFIARTLADFLSAVQETPDRWYCVVMPMADMPAEFHAAREAARTIALDRAESLTRWLLEAVDAPAELDPEIVAHTVTALFEMAARLVLTDPGRYRPERFVSAIRAAVGLIRPR
ncbi:TetR/AcrR family transcriptional regulator [Amycolatopsis umgeniensis]|uniref:AcrR family transcriptional regulator n=1 Tax=Amycolatopsis umgeniensis TaxID=336628 RepID=A0A841AU13_9PSEU|nr:TetR/AcrR family transcriptional regulator [Amycolatopsis umgeniensis]MBB5849980.1 AcrR family transcriptional regulator [Amycolatopsis umgeniensis]